MITKKFKIIFTILFVFFTLEAKSKNIYSKDFNSKELSNYFSGVISHNNQKNEQALKYFKSSKKLLNKHDEYFRKLIFSLVLNQNVDRAIQEIKFLKNKNQSEFFEAQLLLLIDSINKKKFDKTKIYLNTLSQYIEEGTFEKVIYETLRDYTYTFEKKKMSNFKSNFGNLIAINNAFQSCYLDNPKTLEYFDRLKSSEVADYSRYLFFYVNYLINKKRFDLVKEISVDHQVMVALKSKVKSAGFSLRSPQIEMDCVCSNCDQLMENTS